MSVYFCSDLHFGHENIYKFRSFVESSEDNDNQIIRDWKKTITKRDTVYVLGDAAFTTESCDQFGELPGEKYLIRGNHDKLNTSYYLKYFKEVYGFLKYKEFWLSHAPIHPDELRGKINLHGHIHYNLIMLPFNPVLHTFQRQDTRYFNCCVENVRRYGSCLISLEKIRELVKQSVPTEN